MLSFRELVRQLKDINDKIHKLNDKIEEIEDQLSTVDINQPQAQNKLQTELEKALVERKNLENQRKGLKREIRKIPNQICTFILAETGKPFSQERLSDLVKEVSALLDVDSIYLTEPALNEAGDPNIHLPKDIAGDLCEQIQNKESKIEEFCTKFNIDGIDCAEKTRAKIERGFDPVKSSVFVGRRDILKILKSILVLNSKTRLVNLHTQGQGGIGKTQVLNRILETCQSDEYKNSVITPEKLIDFYHTESQSKSGIMNTIAGYCGMENFPEFEDFFKRYRAAIDPSLKGDLHKRLTNAFFHEYQAYAERMAAQGKILVWLFDTYETTQVGIKDGQLSELADTTYSRWLEKVFFPGLLQPLNARVVVAGRHAMLTYDLSRDDAHVHNLQRFSPEDILEFWKQGFNCATVDDILDKLECDKNELELFIDLTDHKPILCALFVDWANYKKPIEPTLWLKEIARTTGRLISPVTDEQKALFEQALVARFRQPDIDSGERLAVTLMAISYRRMTPEILTFLAQELTLSDCEQILKEELKDLSFIKYKGDGVILLHDEMQRMIMKHWWDVQKFGEEIIKGIAKQLVEFYRQSLLAGLDIREDDDAQIYQTELLEYLLMADPKKGLEDFKSTFDGAFINGQLFYSDLLLRAAETFRNKYRDRLPYPEVLHISLRRKRYYIETEYEYELAIERINQILADNLPENLKPIYVNSSVVCQSERTDKDKESFAENILLGHFLLWRGIAKFWLEDFDDALVDFNVARDIFAVHEEGDAWKNWTSNWIGYTHFRQGEFKNAEIWMNRTLDEFYYTFPKVYKRTNYYGANSMFQYCFGNKAILLRHIGKFNSAATHALISLDFLKRLSENQLELSRGHITAGHVLSFSGRLVEAKEHFEQALGILNEVDNRLLRGRLETNLCWMAYSNFEYTFLLEYYNAKGFYHAVEKESVISKESIETANRHALEAIKLLTGLDNETTFQKELADAWFLQAEVHMLTPSKDLPDKWEKAEKAFLNALKYGKESQFKYRIVDTLESLLTMYYYWNGTLKPGDPQYQANLDQIAKYRVELAACDKNLYSNLWGRYYVTEGDMAHDAGFAALFEGGNPDFEAAEIRLRQAFKFYIQSAGQKNNFNVDRFFLIVRIFFDRLNQIVAAINEKVWDTDQINQLRQLLEHIADEWQGQFAGEFDLVFTHIRRRLEIAVLDPVEKKKDRLAEIESLKTQSQERKHKGQYQSALLFIDCQLGLLNAMLEAEPDDLTTRVDWVLSLCSQSGLYRIIGDDHQARRYLQMAKDEIIKIKDQPTLVKALTGRVNVLEGELEYRRGEFGRLLEAPLRGQLIDSRRRFENQFEGGLRRAKIKLTEGIQQLREAIAAWEKSGKIEKERLNQFKQKLAEALFRLGELQMLNEHFDEALQLLAESIDLCATTDYTYRLNDGKQSYLNALYFANQLTNPANNEYLTRRDQYLQDLEDHAISKAQPFFPWLIARWRIIQADNIFSECFTLFRPEQGEPHFVCNKENYSFKKLREMLNLYVEALAYKAETGQHTYAEGYHVLRTRLEQLPDRDSLQNWHQGLIAAWDKHSILTTSDKITDRELLLEVAHILSIMVE